MCGVYLRKAGPDEPRLECGGNAAKGVNLHLKGVDLGMQPVDARFTALDDERCGHLPMALSVFCLVTVNCSTLGAAKWSKRVGCFVNETLNELSHLLL
eukprot:7562847-Pyramimonas_sp.AAC.1